MKLLVFDTSSRAVLLVGVVSDGKLEQSFTDTGDVSVNLAKRIAELWPDEMEAVVVACGPGSYTGIRIGLAAAKGLALARGNPVFGMDSGTLESLASRADEAVKQGRNPEPTYD